MPRGTQDTASSPVNFRLHGCHILWPRFPAGSPSFRFDNSTYAVLQPRGVNTPVWAVPISLAATFGISLIYFPPGTEMVHFPGFARTRLYIQRAVTWFYQIGFPHSEIPGSKPVCGSPGLIAAYRVLHRLLAPRHPPYALSSLTIKLTQHVSILHRIKTSKTSRGRVLQPYSVGFGVVICSFRAIAAENAHRSVVYGKVRLST